MAEQRQRRYQNCYLVAILLFFVATVLTMMQYKIPTIMTSVMELFNIDSTTAAWTMSIFTFVGIIFGLPVGTVLGKVGPRKVIIFGMALDALASIVGAFTPQMGAAALPVLMVTRACEGLALTACIASCPLVLQQCVAPEKNGTAAGIYMLGGMLGATFGGIFTPILFYSVGFQGLWLAYAVIAIVAGLLFIFGVKFPTAEQLALEAGPQEAVKVSPKVFLTRNVLLFYVAFAVFQVLLLAVLSWAPTALQQRGMSPTLSGVVSTLPMLLAIISSTVFGSLCDKTGRCKPLFLLGSVCMAVCTPIMLNMDGAIMWIALVVMGLTAMGLPTVAIAAYPRILGDPKYLTMGMGVLMVVQNLGQFFGSLVPSMLLGPTLDAWMTCGIVLCVVGLIASACLALCKFK